MTLQECKDHLEQLTKGTIKNEDIALENIALLASVQKSTLLQFIPRFTTEPLKIIAIARELDEWQLDALKIFIEVSQERAARLQESNDNLRDFAYVASHDLKEPLRKISTLGDRLQTERNGLSAEGKVYLEKMINASIRMQKMVDDLLSLSQISSDKRFEVVSLDQLMADVLQTFEPRIGSMGATVHVDKLPDAEVVPSQFRQLFQNLVGNALKFASKDRPLVLRITCSMLDKAVIGEVNIRNAPSYLKLVFSDNGIGFDNKFADKIFNVFQRLNSRSEYDGAGIGLAICRRIVENHGGYIQANCSPGKGSEFTIVIPQGNS